MADLAAADVTVALASRDRDFSQFKKITFPTITFGNGAKTVPSGGIPMPAKEYFGCGKEIKRMIVCSSGGSGYVFEYDAANHKLLVFHADYDATGDGALIAATGAAPAAVTLPLMVVGE